MAGHALDPPATEAPRVESSAQSTQNQAAQAPRMPDAEALATTQRSVQASGIWNGGRSPARTSEPLMSAKLCIAAKATTRDSPPLSPNGSR